MGLREDSNGGDVSGTPSVFRNFRKCKEHNPPPIIKWGISGSEKWCEQCKKFIRLRIDWDGHP